MPDLSAKTAPQTPGTSPLRIGFLAPALWAIEGRGNGVIAQARAQAAALTRLGHSVHWLTPWSPTDPADLDVVQFFVGGYGMHWIEHTNRRNLRRLVWAPIIDTNASNFAYRAIAALGTLHPKISTVPGSFRRQALASDLCIARSAHERERLVRGLGVSESKVRIVLNGITPPAPADPELARRTLGFSGDIALHLSIYSDPRKNVLNLIRAVGPLNIPLVIAGAASPGPMLDEITSLARTYPSVSLLGYLEHDLLQSLYAAARVFILPSVHEGTGLAALEAAAHGANIVITSRGGTRDYFGTLARYVEPGDVSGIRTQVEASWNSPRTAALRDHVVSTLTWDHSAASLARAYRDISVTA